MQVESESQPRVKVVRHKSNPFIVDMELKSKSKKVRINSRSSKNQVIVDIGTGEMIGGIEMNTYKRVDTEQFIKMFSDNFGMTLNITAAGLKALNVVIWIMQKKISLDLIPIDKYELEAFIAFQEAHGRTPKISNQVLLRGLAELEKEQIVAKSVRIGSYYINPNFCFNGDRFSVSMIVTKEDSA